MLTPVEGVRLTMRALKRGFVAMAQLQSDIGSSPNQKSGISVIGHFPDYRLVASKIGGFCFDLPLCEALTLSADELWHRNRQFLQDRQNRHDVFLLVTNQKEIREGSCLAREFDFLKNIGACILPVGDLSHSRALDALL